MKKSALRSKMAAHRDTGAELSAAIGVSRTTLSAKMNGTGGAEFTQGEILAIKDRYALTAADVDEIFFTEEVS